jgi:hypothetical protein
MSIEKIERDLRAGLDGVTSGPWMAHMDDFTVRFESPFIPEQRKVALCATGDGAGKNAAHIARCSPENIRALLDELSQLREALVTVQGHLNKRPIARIAARAVIRRVLSEREGQE